MRDLLGLQVAHLAQRERHLRVGRERRVAAGEDEAEAVVFDLMGFIAFNGKCFGMLFFERIEARAAPDGIDRLEAPRRHQPGARIGRDSVARPLLERSAECLVQRLLGEVEVAQKAHQRREDAARLRAIDRFNGPANRVAHAARLLTASAMHAGQRQRVISPAGSIGG